MARRRRTPREAAEALRLTAQDLLRLGVVDRIVPEPLGGAHRAPKAAIDSLGEAIFAALRPLSASTAPGCAPSAAKSSWRWAPAPLEWAGAGYFGGH